MNFRQLRETTGLTADQVAKAAGVTRAAINNIEGGRVRSPRYDTIARLARALSMTTDAVATACLNSYADRAVQS